ncbi:S8 family peptidase [Bacillus sp. SCS-153A]|uniref:S8 family peptidase n=1 Tax=Rossellomorea sedimentorum TaxID=3115294 RepID=UPI003906BF45
MRIKKWAMVALVIGVCMFLVSPALHAKDQEVAVISGNKELAASSYIIKVASMKEFDAASLQALGGQVLDEWNFINTIKVQLPSSKVSQLASFPGILAVTPEAGVVSNAKGGNKGGNKGGDTPPPSNNDPGTTNPPADNSNGNAVNHSYTSMDDQLANTYNYAVRADRVWAKGITGKGITVAVLDSGIDGDAGSDFGDRLIRTVKLNSDANYAADKYGHGTHVAGIIAGDGKKSGGKYMGIAPGANLISVKYSNDEGKATEGDFLSALEWVYDNHEKYNIRVVNISSGVNVKQSYKQSAVAAAVELLWHKGIVVVVSSGNIGGTDCSTCYAPANDPYVITVGAVDDNNTKDLTDDYMKSWSSIGKTLDGHNKPEIVAPGSEIVAYMPGGALRKKSPENVVDEEYFKMGGTSMATPVVSGIVALMLEKHPEWTPDQVKWVLQNSTREYGLVDMDAKDSKDTKSTKSINQEHHNPGLVSADKAVFFNEVPGQANQGLEPSSFLVDPATGEVLYDHMSWAHMSWAHMSWAHMSWAHMSWAHSFDK